MSPKISVIIPAHNEEDYIKSTLYALKIQTFQDFETIVVANGCNDGTEEILRKKGVNYLSLSKANVSLARNEGAKVAAGDLLVFLDADTLLEKDALQKINSKMSNVVVGTTLAKPDNSRFKFKMALGFKNFYMKSRIYKGCSGVLACNSAVFDKVGGYDNLVVREHRKLILKMLDHGKYGVVKTHATTSMRRFSKWGLVKGLYFWGKEFVKDKTVGLSDEYESVR
jgi:glycosyltransferase involved in cell wall biosynthesis